MLKNVKKHVNILLPLMYFKKKTKKKHCCLFNYYKDVSSIITFLCVNPKCNNNNSKLIL